MYGRPFPCHLHNGLLSPLIRGNLFTSTIHVSLLMLPISPFLIQRVALDHGMFLPINQDRPLHAIVNPSGSYHLFVNRDYDIVWAIPDHEKNLDRRSIPFFVMTIDSQSWYHFSQSKIAISSLLVWDVKSLRTVDLLGSQPRPSDASTL